MCHFSVRLDIRQSDMRAEHVAGGNSAINCHDRMRVGSLHQDYESLG